MSQLGSTCAALLAAAIVLVGRTAFAQVETSRSTWDAPAVVVGSGLTFAGATATTIGTTLLLIRPCMARCDTPHEERDWHVWAVMAGAGASSMLLGTPLWIAGGQAVEPGMERQSEAARAAGIALAASGAVALPVNTALLAAGPCFSDCGPTAQDGGGASPGGGRRPYLVGIVGAGSLLVGGIGLWVAGTWPVPTVTVSGAGFRLSQSW